VEHAAARRGTSSDLTEKTMIGEITMCEAAEGDVATSEDFAAAFEGFDTEGISAEELKYWSQLAPEDQKLAEVEDLPAIRSTTSSKSLEEAEREQSLTIGL